MPAGPLFVVEFDYRSDDGPRLVGPFRTRKAADEWTSRQLFGEASWYIARLWMPPNSELG
jgi:hypothetical protein